MTHQNLWNTSKSCQRPEGKKQIIGTNSQEIQVSERTQVFKTAG